MKRLFTILGCVAVLATAALSSCTLSREYDIVPAFPTMIEATVVPGEILEATIEPNYEWEAVIDDAYTSRFQFLIGVGSNTVPVSRISGKGGFADIKIKVSESTLGLQDGLDYTIYITMCGQVMPLVHLLMDPVELSENEIVKVRQRVTMSFSADYRALAKIEVAGKGLDGEALVLDGALYSESLVDEAEYMVSDLTLPTECEVEYTISQNTDVTPEIGKEYTFASNITIVLELLNTKGEVVSTKTFGGPDNTVTVVAEETTDWETYLSSVRSVYGEVKRDENGQVVILD